jgi:putative hydrolase of the HAD superfamily
MSSPKWAIGLDADDTLWHNESIFEATHRAYRALLAKYHDADNVDRTLFATEMRNLDAYGYGVKGFTLSAIETAIELSEGKISGDEIAQIIEYGREMLAHPVVLFDEVSETVERLASRYRLLLITKGDLRDQERKLAKSGVRALFHHVEIVSEKDEATYAALLRRHGITPSHFLMVGNSLKSDILPVLALGGSAAYIPYRITWAAEHVEAVPSAPGRFFQLGRLSEVEAVIETLAAQDSGAPRTVVTPPA